MKYLLIFFIALFYITLFYSCKKESKERFNDKAAGIWIPYQLKYSDGRIEQTSMQLSSMFGAYDESVYLKEDLTFLPGSTYPNNTFNADTLEKGVYTYSETEKTLTFMNDGAWVYKVVHLDNDELWLSSFDSDPAIYYFKRH